MSVFSKLEGGLDSAFDRAAGAVFRGPIEPAQIAKRAEKQMQREKLVGAGKQYAPTLFTVLVNANDDSKLFGFYPTMAAEIETYLVAKGTQSGLKFDGRPLVRFIVDEQLKSRKFDVIAENVSAPIIAQLREEEQVFYGLKDPAEMSRERAAAQAAAQAAVQAAQQVAAQAAVQVGAPSVPPLVAPPAAVIGSARLSDLSAGKSYPLTRTLLVVGRDRSCDITIHDANASRNHAQLSQDVIGTWKLVDLGSTNGTLLNGSPVTSALLRDGDQITVGVTVLEFREIKP